jgi:hypothetical protein
MALVAPVVASTLAGLGTPTEDRREGVLELPSGRTIELTWRKGVAGWFQEAPDLTFTQHEPLAMRGEGTTTWSYVYSAENPLPADQVPARGFGFDIHMELNPREVWDAGFRMQEFLCAAVMSQEAGARQDVDGGNGQCAAAWFSLAHGDPFLSPASENHGVRLRGPLPASNVWRWWATGWLNSPVAQPASGVNWYPNWYSSGPSLNFRWFRAVRRWVGGATLSALQEPIA